MKHLEISPINFGLGLRVALLSWLVAIGTLTVFVIEIIPQQKVAFLRNLNSKANSVAVSLHDAIAGAAINEDYATLVSASQTLIEGDPNLEFLVIAKNDGFAIVNQQGGWRVEPEIDKFWISNQRKERSTIATVPILDRQVFHHAQPFDYSSIKWGWFHVGLSLDDYNRSVKLLYHQTLLLGLSCAVISLLICLGYAHHLVKPLVRLRHVVYQIANGNLKVRAESVRNDEIGSLADSVNIMTEELLHRDSILDSIRFTAEHFLHSSHWENAIDDILEKVGQAVDASRVYIFENNINDAGQLCMSQRCEWVAAGISSQLPNLELQSLPYTESGLSKKIISLLKENKTVSMTLASMSPETRALIEPQGILALLFVPILVGKNWWGFIGFDDCIHERVWLESEQDSGRAVADMLGTTIARQQAQL